MSWLNTLGPLQWAILAAIPPVIVLLYFLKLRRQPLVVPSTYLWSKTIEDLHVNSLWQRLRNSILLLLQLLLVLMLIAACLRPGCEGEELAGNRFIFLIDQSASMSATDVNGGTRLDEAKRLVRETVDRMKPGDAGMLIGFSDKANVVQSYTTNRALLKRKLDDIVQSERGTDLTEALNASSGLANPGRTSTDATDIQVADAMPASLMIFSDGGVKSVPNFSLGVLKPEYFPVGGFEPPHNVGFTAFALSDATGSDQKLELFAQLQNSYDQDRAVNVSLWIEGQLFDAAAKVNLKVGESRGISFDLTALAASVKSPQKIKLQIDDPDDYQQDNVVYGVLNPPQPAKILVISPGNEYLRLALDTESISRMATLQFENRDYLKSPQYESDTSLGNYELVIYDLCSPEKLPMCNTIFFGACPPGDEWKFADRQFPTVVTNFDQGHPIMNSLQLLKLSIVESNPISGPQGCQALVESAGGPIISVDSRDSFQDLVISFPLLEVADDGQIVVNTNWPSQLSFPLFIQNAVGYLTGGGRYITTANNAPGSLVQMRVALGVEEVTIETPDKRRERVKRGRDNTLVFTGTERSGWYLIQFPTDENVDRPFAVNLLDARESDLRVRDKLEIGYEEFTASANFQPARREFWKWLAGLAIVVALVEWYIYNRRVFI